MERVVFLDQELLTPQEVGSRSGTQSSCWGAHRLPCPFSLQELPGGDPKEGPFRDDPCPLEGKSCSPDLTDATPYPRHLPPGHPGDGDHPRPTLPDLSHHTQASPGWSRVPTGGRWQVQAGFPSLKSKLFLDVLRNTSHVGSVTWRRHGLRSGGWRSKRRISGPLPVHVPGDPRARGPEDRFRTRAFR